VNGRDTWTDCRTIVSIVSVRLDVGVMKELFLNKCSRSPRDGKLP
jgi:hypothetical protein